MNNGYDFYRMLKKPENLIEDLNEYISSFDNKWKTQIKPCNEEKIKKLIEISEIERNGYQLPKSYIEYLRYMGEDDGGLLESYYAGYYDVDTLIEDYPDLRSEEYGYSDLEKNQFAFLIGEMTNQPQYIMNFLDETNYYIELGENEFIENFDKFLYRMALAKKNSLKCEGIIQELKYRMTFIKSIQENSSDLIQKDILGKVEEIGSEFGYNKVWFSDKWTYISEKEKGDIECGKEKKIYGKVRCNDLNEIYNLRTKFEELGFTCRMFLD